MQQAQGEKDEALVRAEAAVAVGDAWGAVDWFWRSRAFDGLTRRISQKWPSLDEENVYSAVADAVEELHSALVAGRSVQKLVHWLFKVADIKALRLYERRARDGLRDPADLVEIEWTQPLEPDSEVERADLVKVARMLARQVPNDTQRKILDLHIDAAAEGIPDLSLHDISEVVGLRGQPRAGRTRA